MSRLIDDIVDMAIYGNTEAVNPEDVALRAALDRLSEMAAFSRDQIRVELSRIGGKKFLADLRSKVEDHHADPSGGLGEKIQREIMENGIAIMADDASDWFSSHCDFNDISFSDIPNATPPFPKFWVEAKFDKHRFGMLVHAEDLRKKPTKNLLMVRSEIDLLERWKVSVRTIIRFNGDRSLLCDSDIRYSVDGNGKIIVQPELAAGGPLQSFERFYIGVLLTAVSFIHCKNIKLVPVEAPRKLVKARAKRGKPPYVKYHTLIIDPMKQILRQEGRATEQGVKRALHVCRGHFRTYSADRPLFGRVVGTVFVSQHRRGGIERGVVVKDYSIKAPAMAEGGVAK